MCCSESKSGFYGTSLESTFERRACGTGQCPSVSRSLYIRLTITRRHYVLRYAVRLSVRPLSSVLGGGSLIKLAINIQYVSRNCCKGLPFKGQRTYYDHFCNGQFSQTFPYRRILRTFPIR